MVRRPKGWQVHEVFEVDESSAPPPAERRTRDDGGAAPRPAPRRTTPPSSGPLERAKGKFGGTKLSELKSTGRFPEPVLVNGRNLWLEDEAMFGIAKFVSDEATGAWKRDRPKNRHEQRKARR